MSILTDCRAGDQKARVTYRSDAYASLSRFIAGAEDVLQDESSQQLVVPVTMHVIDADRVPIQHLVDLRRREAGAQGDDLRRLR